MLFPFLEWQVPKKKTLHKNLIFSKLNKWLLDIKIERGTIWLIALFILINGLSFKNVHSISICVLLAYLTQSLAFSNWVYYRWNFESSDDPASLAGRSTPTLFHTWSDWSRLSKRVLISQLNFCHLSAQCFRWRYWIELDFKTCYV